MRCYATLWVRIPPLQLLGISRYNRREMPHTVYKTNNLVNGKFYIGVHKTADPQDEYFGSGKIIKRAVAKYGEANFRKEVLFIFETAREAYQKEKELVAIYRGDRMCYNLNGGGHGGFAYMNENGLSALGGKRSGAGRIKKRAADPEYAARQDAVSRANIKIAQKFVTKEMILRAQVKAIEAWRGRHHSPEYCKRKSADLQGEANPRYGTMWINNGGIEQAIKRECLDVWLGDGWQVGRPKRAKPIPEHLLGPRRKLNPVRPPAVTPQRRTRAKPKSEWKRQLPDWPEDKVLIAEVEAIGQRAVARRMGISNVAVHARLKKMLGLRLKASRLPLEQSIGVRVSEAQPSFCALV